MKKYFGKIQNLVPWQPSARSRTNFQTGKDIFSPEPKPDMLYIARKNAKSYVDWYQNYENQLAGSKVMAFFSSKIRKKSFSAFFIYFRIFPLVFERPKHMKFGLDM
jgi:hypothetical protein